MLYVPHPIDTTDIILPRELMDLIEPLAENSHDIWARDRMVEGWTYGPQRDDAARKHPDLIPYAELPDSEREYDRRSVMETMKAMVKLGYRLERGPDTGAP